MISYLFNLSLNICKIINYLSALSLKNTILLVVKSIKTFIRGAFGCLKIFIG